MPRPWQVVLCVCGGVVIGTGVVVGRVSNVTSYLFDDPRACINCHVMTDAYVSWQRGSHGRNAVCIDCHVPHDSIVAKLAYKATDGLKHSYVFTLRGEPQVLKLSPRAVPVVQANCVRCHDNRLWMVRVAGAAERKCWDCHRDIHGTVRSLSSSPAVLRPSLPDAGLHRGKEGDEL